jgi:hypothetical protein
MNPVSRKLGQEDQDLVAEYLKNGGQVTKGKYSIGTLNFNYNQKRPKQNTTEEKDTDE